MEKRYVVSYRVKTKWYYLCKEHVWFTAEMAPLSIASLICWHGYRTKQGAQKAYDRERNSGDDYKNAYELLEFEIDTKNTTMSCKVLASCSFETT